MAIRFPKIPQTMYLAEKHTNYFFDHLIACVKHGQAPGELRYPNSVAIDSNNNQIYVAEGYYSREGYSGNIARVSIFSETGEFIGMFSHPHMKSPYGLAIHRDNVYVTDIVGHCVFHFRVEADFHLVARLGSRGSGIGQFEEPRQLALSTKGDVFVADIYNNRVQILDSFLHYKRHLSHVSMTGPLDVKLTQDEVFVLCQASPCIKVFSYTGNLIRSLIPCGGIGMQVRAPWFFCLDTNSHLLFSDCLDHQIKIFSKEGKLLHTLGKEGHEVGMFNYPKGIALTNNLKLVIVSENRKYSLQIFYSD